MKLISGKDFAKVLARNGWVLARIQGSHPIYIKPGRIERLSVPIHRNQPLKIGLLNHLLKLARLTQDDLYL